MGNPPGQFTVVGQKQKSGGIKIQPPHWKHSLPISQLLDELGQVGTLLRIVESGDHTRRLMEREIERRARELDSLAVNLDAVFRRVGLGTQLANDRAVDGYSSLENPSFRLPARCQPRPRENFLQTFHRLLSLGFRVSRLELEPGTLNSELETVACYAPVTALRHLPPAAPRPVFPA